MTTVMTVSEVRFFSCTAHCAADLYLPPGVEQSCSRPGIVIGHGSTMVKEALVEAARRLCDAGYVVLAIDYRGWGRSDGEPRALLRPIDQVEDFRSAITYLRSRPEVDPARIGIWGASFGGGIVLHVAAVDRRVKCVVSQSPAPMNGRRFLSGMHGADNFHRLLASLQEDWECRSATAEGRRVPWICIPSADILPILPGGELANEFMQQAKAIWPTYRADTLLASVDYILDWAPERYIELIAPTPLLIVTNGGFDVVHALDEIQRAYRQAGEPKRLTVLPYDVVGLYSGPGEAEALGHAVAWFDEYL
jgi:hypothetical protein